MTCTMPFEAERSVASMPAATSCARVSVPPFSVVYDGAASTDRLMRRPSVT